MENELYLVTGGCGFLGSHVVRKLVDAHKQVRVFALNNDPAVKYLPQGVELYYGNLCDKESVNRFFDVKDGVKTICLHIASMVTVNPDYSEKLVHINVDGTRNILDATVAHKECQKLVYVSSTGAIPETKKGTSIKEVSSFDQEKVVGWYSKTKAMASQLVLDYVKQYNTNACIVHPSGILGPNDFAISETTGTIIKIIKGQMPVGMRGSFNLCDVRDLAEGVILASEKGKKGECYILGNETVTLKQMVKMLQRELHCKGPKFYLPLGMADLIAKNMEKKAKKEGTKPLMTRFSIYNLKRNNVFDYSEAKTELGYTTRPYSETLSDEAKWLKEAGYLN